MSTMARSYSTLGAHFDSGGGSLESKGLLLTPDVLEKAAALKLPEQTAADYRVPPGLALRDEIARYYLMAAAHSRTHVNRTGTAGDVSATDWTRSLLEQCFGFDDIQQTDPVWEFERKLPIGHASHGGRVPIVIAPLAREDDPTSGIDLQREQFGDGSRRRSATQLLQEYLNQTDSALWGVVSDGTMLRLMRRNPSLTRSAWIEGDLGKIFAEDRFAQFSRLWLLFHASRFGKVGTDPSDCALERWRQKGLQDGAAVREKLRVGVEAAIRELGRGFLANEGSRQLRSRIQVGSLTAIEYFEALLRLVYRLIFLFVAEDRNRIHFPQTSTAVRDVYRNGYSVGRLRKRCTKASAFDRQCDIWHGLRTLFRSLAHGEPRLGLPALGGLFETSTESALDEASISNRHLLKAVWHLAWFRPYGQRLIRVNWRGYAD